MALTRSFRETITEQLADADFRREFLREAVANMVAGDLDTAKSVLREYINGTVGFVALGEALSKSPKSLMRMLSAEGNPQARNLCEMLACLQKIEGTVLEVRAAAAACDRGARNGSVSNPTHRRVRDEWGTRRNGHFGSDDPPTRLLADT